MFLKPRPEIEHITPAEHGGITFELRRRGYELEKLLDFSTCLNPFGPPPGIKEALSSLPIEHYPDSDSTELKFLLAQKLGLSPKCLMIGSGSVALLRLITLAYLSPNDSVLLLEPTFGEYEIAAYLSGAQIIKERLKEENGFKPDMARLEQIIQEQQPKMIFLCNPNNPTGQYLSKEEVEHLLKLGPQSLFILDEAYVSFVRNKWNSLDLIPKANLLILRSLTKDFALAGLRLGYLIGEENLIELLSRIRPPWSVNVAAQVAGLLALKNEDWLKDCREKLLQAKGYLQLELERLGFRVLPSETHFFLVKVGQARRFKDLLLKRGILIRDCTSFGLPAYIRLAARGLPDCQRLISEIKEVKDGKAGETHLSG